MENLVKNSSGSSRHKTPRVVLRKPSLNQRRKQTTSRRRRILIPTRQTSLESLSQRGKKKVVASEVPQLPKRICEPIKGTEKLKPRPIKSTHSTVLLCCHWRHCPLHKQVLKDYYDSPDKNQKVFVYHGCPKYAKSHGTPVPLVLARQRPKRDATPKVPAGWTVTPAISSAAPVHEPADQKTPVEDTQLDDRAFSTSGDCLLGDKLAASTGREVPVEDTTQNQQPTQQQPSRAKFPPHWFDCPPSTSREYPVLKVPHRSQLKATRPSKQRIRRQPFYNPDYTQIKADTSGEGHANKYKSSLFGSISSWFHGKKKMTVLTSGAEPRVPPRKRIRLVHPDGEPKLQSYHPMASPIDAAVVIENQPKPPPSSPMSPKSPPLVVNKSRPFTQTSEFRLMIDLQEKFNLAEEQQGKAPLSTALSMEEHRKYINDIRVMLNGYGGLVDSHKAHSPDDSSPNTEGCSPVATLCNLGNTCFLNSVLYTLRYAPHFLHNLHHLAMDLVEYNGRYSHLKSKSSSLGRGIGGGSKSWSNKDLSTMGQGGIPLNEDKIAVATLRLHELYEGLHSAELRDHIEPYQPQVFLAALRDVNTIFEGNQQHDAHELLVCLLDNIRETCCQLGQLSERQRCIIPPPPPPSGPLPPSKSSFSYNVRKSLKLGKTKTNGATDKKSTLSAKTFSSLLVPCCGSNFNSQKAGPSNDPALELPGPSNDSVPANQPPYPESICPDPTTLLASKAEQPQDDGPLIVDQALSQHEEDGPRVGYNFISEDFQGVTQVETTCMECEQTRERKETFCDICVPITPSANCDTESVNALYHSAMVTEELLQDSNKYWCEYCGRYNEARRCVRYVSLPRLLILQLKRFSSSSFGSCVQKVNEFMPTPLNLSCFCIKCKDLEENRKPHRGYQLYAVIMHIGSNLASGHYVTYVCGRDTVVDCANCTRDKRKTASLSGGAGKPAANPAAEKHGLFRFFKSSKTTYPSPLDSRGAYYPPCRSADCCGVKLESNEPVWLECDDETIRMLTQKQLEELLSPKKSISLTPYLLFYSRI